MADQVRIRELQDREISEAHALVSSVFDEFVAPHFSYEGINEFKSFIDPQKLKERLKFNNFILVAEIDSDMIGVIGVRDFSHVFLLFVKGDHQGEGIARSLLSDALNLCKKSNPNLEKITVNSSPNAVEAYRRMGFVQTSEEQLVNGIRFIPMVLDLAERDAALP